MHEIHSSVAQNSCAPPLPHAPPSRHLVQPPDPLFPDGDLGHLERRLLTGTPLHLNFGLQQKRGVQERPHSHEKGDPIGVTVGRKEGCMV